MNTQIFANEQKQNKVTMTSQYSTFYVAENLYGIDVTKVQEIVKPMTMTPVPLAPVFVIGLINLRGQVATAIGLRELFHLSHAPTSDMMNVVCRCEGSLISLLIDKIGDVIEVSDNDFEPPPQTINLNIRKYMSGVYKISNQILSVLDVDTIVKYINSKNISE